jgi:hypothetical protein
MVVGLNSLTIQSRLYGNRVVEAALKALGKSTLFQSIRNETTRSIDGETYPCANNSSIVKNFHHNF